jgi:hypothetical protein
MKEYIKAIDLIQWIWKEVYNTEKSKTQIRRDLEQGAIKLNDQKLFPDTIVEFERTKKNS